MHSQKETPAPNPVDLAFYERDPIDLALDWIDPTDGQKPVAVIMPANDKRPGGDWEAGE